MQMSGSGSRPLLVLYGSQTGTAQEVAERVGREGTRLHFSVKVSSLDTFPVTSLPGAPLVVYVVSTTGQGEEPENMVKTWKFLLRRNLPPTSLSAQKFGVLGLGDSSYHKFNHVAKKLGRRLLQLGGDQLLPPGLGDDQHDLGPDFVIDSWLERFWNLALQLMPLPEGVQPLGKEVLPPPKYSVVWLEEETAAYTATIPETVDGLKGYSQSTPYLAPLLSCDRQTPSSHFQDVRLVRLDITGSGITYKPGDVALVQPSNLQTNIDFFFSLFPSLNPDRKFLLNPSDPNIPLPPTSLLPRPCSVRQAVTHFLDLQSIPRRYFFELLSHFTEDEMEREKFVEFNTAEGQQDLYEYCNRPRRHILEVLYDFRHTTPNIPFEYLFDLIPPIKPRSFSIASSVVRHSGVLELLVAVVRYRSSLKSPRLGLCSNWLASLTSDTRVPVWVRPGTLRFPGPGLPSVMVGPGTGVAPFRSFCSEGGSQGGRRLLFFGCRNRDSDYFFRDEWPELGVEVVTAFSRDQEDKVYVQHRMDERQELLCDLVLDQGACFFVAGNSKMMPKQVLDALTEALATRLGSERAVSYVDTMEIQGRYQTETWA